MAYAQLTSYPPLSSLTVVPSERDEIIITALLDWDKSRPNFPFEVVFCHTTSPTSHPSLWSTILLQNVQSPWMIEDENAFRSAFQTTLLRESFASNEVIHFTFKYKVNQPAPWQWQGTQPGRLIMQTKDTSEIDAVIKVLDLDDNWSSELLPGAAGETQVFKFETKTPMARSHDGDDEEKLCFQVLGKVKSQLQYMALIRLEPYWLGPRQGGDFFYLAEDAILCSFLLDNGKIFTIVTMTGIDNTYSIIRSNEKGEVVIAARCDSDGDVPFRALASIANTFENAHVAVINAARDIVNAQPLMSDLAKCAQTNTDVESELANERWYDSIAFCTWNGLGRDLTESNILSALSSLAENKINISTLIIDDGWQVVGPIPNHDESDPFNCGFADLTVNSSAAPSGLSTLVKKIKAAQPQIEDIGVWHALMGYWGGISPSGQIARDYQTMEVPSLLMGNVRANVTSVAPESLQKFHDDFYTYLSESGITFVKTDVQHMLSTFRSSSSRRALISAYQRAWTTSHLTHFKAKVISCMSQIPEILWHSVLQTHTPRVVLRNSDDFYPEIPSSHPWHIWTNAHNALFTIHLNVVPDWDMFQTKHEFSAYHAAARCISGGPILITDTPGEHDVDLMHQMTALDARGRSIALRPGFARTIRIFDEYKDGNVLKIGTTTKVGCSLLGLWNIAERDVTTFIALSEFLDVQNTSMKKVLIRSFRSGQIFGPFDTSVIGGKHGEKAESLIYATVPVREWDIFTRCPIQTVKAGGYEVEVAVLGLIDKMSGAAAILDSNSTDSETGQLIMKVKLKALGKLALWTSAPSNNPIQDLKLLSAGSIRTIDISAAHVSATTLASSRSDVVTTLTTIDMEAEWRDRKLFDAAETDIQIQFRVDSSS